MPRARTTLLLFAVFLIALAGCSSIGTQTTATDTNATIETTPTATDANADAESLKQQAIDAMKSVSTYRVEAEEFRTIEANLVQEVNLTQVTTVDRRNRRIHKLVNQSVRGQTVELESYLINATLYQHHPAYVRQFSTAWLSANFSANASLAWQTRDTLARHRRILEIAEPRLNGTETINGTQAYRLEANPELGELERVFAEMVTGSMESFNESTYSISEASVTLWQSTATARPLKVAIAMNSTISNEAQTLVFRQSATFRYDYETTPSIELPEAAKNAIPISEALNQSATPS